MAVRAFIFVFLAMAGTAYATGNLIDVLEAVNQWPR